jgi:flagellin-like protein
VPSTTVLNYSVSELPEMRIPDSYRLNKVNGNLAVAKKVQEKMSTPRIFRQKKAISPILATLLLIVIAVAAIVVTYAWITTYMNSTTQNAGFIPFRSQVSFFDDAGTKKIAIDIGNSGTASGQIIKVYIGTSATNAESQTTTPPTPLTVAGGDVTSFNVTYTWTAGQTYYFNVVPNSGAAYPFQEQAPQTP